MRAEFNCVSRLKNVMHNILPDDILYMHHNRPNVTCDMINK